MFRPIALYIGLRYTRAKRRNHFISFISGFSIIGMALGIAVLITVLSVMNGFDQQIRKRVFTLVPHVTVSGLFDSLSRWQSTEKKIHQFSEVEGVAPFIDGQALLTNQGGVLPAMITGIDPARQNQVSDLSQKMVLGSLDALKAKQFGIVLGERLAANLNASLGSKVVVMTPQGSVTPVGFVPRVKRFTVVGVFHAGDGFSFDSAYAFINLNDAQTLYKLGDKVSGLRLKIQDPFAAPAFSRNLLGYLQGSYRVGNWTEQLGEFFHAVALEKNMMFLILMLIIAVAAFNLVSTLVMVVNEKQADIAILRTLGCTPRAIMGIFVVQGAVVGLFGLLLGLVFGFLLASHVTEVAQFIQNVFHVQLISSSVYVVDYLPSRIEAWDVIRVGFAAVCMSLIATIYPAWRAARTQPAEALRYE